MRVEDLSPGQLSKLQEAKAEVIRQGLLQRGCTDQRFLDAVVVHRRNPAVFHMLGGVLQDGGGKLSKAFEVLTQLADNLTHEEGIWDENGWRPA
jgi:hypothetical protein